MEPGAAGLSGRVEASGAESSFQALRGHGRGCMWVWDNCQTPPGTHEITAAQVAQARSVAHLSPLLWVPGFDRIDPCGLPSEFT